jgi:glycosyltransferase involved in cell wall biosynthesis
VRVLFDSSVTDFDRGGTMRYVRSLLPEMNGPGTADVSEVRMQDAWPWSRRLPRAARIILHDLAWVPRGSVALGRRLGAGLYHGAGFKVPMRAPFATSVTVHDDTPWDSPPTARLYNRVYMRSVMERAAPHLAGAITSTDATARAIVGRLPALAGRMHVTPWGVDHGVFRPRPQREVAAAQARAHVSAPYVLLVSPYGPRKNEAAMLAALGRVAVTVPGVRALVVGRHGIPGDDPLPVVRAGRVSDDDLAALYSGASALLYASLKEGFGMPVLEAMASGCPVVTSAGTVLEEVSGGAAALADPTSVESMAEAVTSVLSDAALRDRLRQAGAEHARSFTWERTARLTSAAWAKMA